MYLSSASLALSTLDFMGYSLSIPNWFLFIVFLSFFIGSLAFIFRLIFSAKADDK